MGLGPVRRTIQQSKGASRKISYLMKIIKIVHRSQSLDRYLESKVSISPPYPLGHDLLKLEKTKKKLGKSG